MNSAAHNKLKKEEDEEEIECFVELVSAWEEFSEGRTENQLLLERITLTVPGIRYLSQQWQSLVQARQRRQQEQQQCCQLPGDEDEEDQPLLGILRVEECDFRQEQEEETTTATTFVVVSTFGEFVASLDSDLQEIHFRWLIGPGDMFQFGQESMTLLLSSLVQVHGLKSMTLERLDVCGRFVASRFEQLLVSPHCQVQSLHLVNCAVERDLFQVLGSGLKHHHVGLRNLEFFDLIMMQDDGLAVLANALVESPSKDTLQLFLLVRNRNLTCQAWPSLARILAGCRHLKEFDLISSPRLFQTTDSESDDNDNNNKNSVCYPQFIQAVRDHSDLKKLVLRGCHMSALQIQPLLEALEHNSILHELDLREVTVSTTFFQDFVTPKDYLTKSLPNMKGLSIFRGNLNWSWPGLLPALAKNTSLVVVDSYNAPPPNQVLDILARNMVLNDMLPTLWNLIQQNATLPAATLSLCIAMLFCKSPHDSSPVYSWVRSTFRLILSWQKQEQPIVAKNDKRNNSTSPTKPDKNPSPCQSVMKKRKTGKDTADMLVD